MPAASWLRDIFISSTEIVQEVQLRPLRQVAKSRITQLKINGKVDIFEGCELESQLCWLVATYNMLGLPLTDYELQKGAAGLLDRLESESPQPSQHFTGFLTRLVWTSKNWLAPLYDRGRRFPNASIARGNNIERDLATVCSPSELIAPELASTQQQQGGLIRYWLRILLASPYYLRVRQMYLSQCR